LLKIVLILLVFLNTVSCVNFTSVDISIPQHAAEVRYRYQYFYSTVVVFYNKIFRFPVQMLCDICKTRGALTVHISAQDPVQLAFFLVLPQSLYTTQSHSVCRGVLFFLKGSFSTYPGIY
jgi:hypothetical protein